jgi:hypothetical protein
MAVSICELNLLFCFFRKWKSGVVETLVNWKENQTQLDSKPIRKVQAIGSEKGCMKGKGGPENSNGLQKFGSQMGEERGYGLVLWRMLWKLPLLMMKL